MSQRLTETKDIMESTHISFSAHYSVIDFIKVPSTSSHPNTHRTLLFGIYVSNWASYFLKKQTNKQKTSVSDQIKEGLLGEYKTLKFWVLCHLGRAADPIQPGKSTLLPLVWDWLKLYPIRVCGAGEDMRFAASGSVFDTLFTISWLYDCHLASWFLSITFISVKDTLISILQRCSEKSGKIHTLSQSIKIVSGM